MVDRFKGYTLSEAQEALADAISARKAAETAQSYQTGIGQQKQMANLDVLYKREDAMREIVATLDGMSSTSTASVGPVKNYGVYSRR